MARACTVCIHPERAAIDAALVGGEPNRRVAARAGISETSVRRHREKHVPGTLVLAQDAEEETSAGNLLERVRAAETHARGLARQAQEEGDLRAAVAGLKVVLDALALLDRVAERLAERKAVEPRTLAEFFERLAAEEKLDVS